MENSKITIDIEEYNKLLVIKTKYETYYNRLKASNEKIVDNLYYCSCCDKTYKQLSKSNHLKSKIHLSNLNK